MGHARVTSHHVLGHLERVPQRRCRLESQTPDRTRVAAHDDHRADVVERVRAPVPHVERVDAVIGMARSVQVPVPLVGGKPLLVRLLDPIEIEKTYEERFATDEWYRHLYRTSHAYHGVHPFYMWYWGAHALDHVGAVIIVGGDPRAVRRLGFKPASTLRDALEMAEDVVGRDPSVTHFHCPPMMLADVR